ncbi:hypothetical protein, partial [Agrobacterium larrymoorei]|uniref:hypothetical protein n=1 Tax=Agrobacterium larrymoorei TaxID=160699 RepID=UPI001AEC223B
GSSSNPPGGNGRRTWRRFRTGWRSSPDARPGRIDKRQCEQRLPSFDPSVRISPPGVPTAHRLMVERDHEDRSESQAVHRKTLHLPRSPRKGERTDRKVTIWPALETCWRVRALRKTDRDYGLYEMFGARILEGRCG